MIESPVAADCITNRQATQNASIYHTCSSVLNALSYLKEFESLLNVESSAVSDPLTQLWEICKTGTSLCLLFNMLSDVIPIEIDLSATNKSKIHIYRFIVACQSQLKVSKHNLFTVTELSEDDTNGLVKVVNIVKDILELLLQQGTLPEQALITQEADLDSPKDMRDNVVHELLSTERKYVQDLEELQKYMKEVRAQKILSPDAIHNLFGNLNTLVDFQRRFLVQIEAQAACSPQRQRFGFLFIQYEPAFIVYEPFCANFKTAQDLVVQETQKLKKLSQIMSPEYELPAMLIKPIQRVCKYPLLLQQLIKSTPEEWAYFEENKEGLEAIQRVTTRVNETKRVQENALMLKEIKTKVYTEDGNENLLDKFGTLLLHDKFVLQKKESDHAKERVVFLFQKAILLFKEVKDTNKNTISIKKKKKDGTLMVRGRIPMSGIDHVKGFVNQAGNHILAVTWKEKDVSQTIHLNCRNEELVRQWIRTIVEIKEPVARPENLPATPQTMTSETYTMSDCYGDNDWDYYSSYNLDEEASACTFESSPSPYESRSNSTQYHSELSELARRDSPGAYHSPRTLHNIPSSSYLQSLSEHPSPFPSPLTTEGFLQASLISSPPISHPSSPNNEILGALWQRRQQPRQPETAEWAYEEKNIHSRDMKTWSSYLNISSGTSNRRSSNQDTTEDRVKIRIHYQGSACAVVVPTDIDYRQLSVIIEDKVKRCIEETTFSLIRLQYEDENGDKVTIRSTLDVRMGLQIKGPNNIVDFHVNVYQ